MANYLRTKMAKISVYVLHSVVAKEDQNLACSLVPSGERRVILATSMAESSVTIEGLSCIIDTGITRDSESQDLFGLTVLCDRWSDATVVRQRMGRAGRTQCGMNIRLFTEHVVAEYMPRWQHPQWTVASVAEAALLIKLHLADNQDGPDVTWEAILSQLLVPPGTGLVNTALGQLCRSGFMRLCQVPDCLPLQGSQGVVARPESCLPARQTSNMSFEITACGRFSASLPADLRCGRSPTFETH